MHMCVCVCVTPNLFNNMQSVFVCVCLCATARQADWGLGHCLNMQTYKYSGVPSAQTIFCGCFGQDRSNQIVCQSHYGECQKRADYAEADRSTG